MQASLTMLFADDDCSRFGLKNMLFSNGDNPRGKCEWAAQWESCFNKLV